MKLLDLCSDIKTELYERLGYKIEFKIKRLVCWIKGCKITGGCGGFNLPIEASYYECKRCGAAESNYQGNTDFGFLEGIIK
jgi:hypothetical protein